jgi:hypothetical protein
VPLTDLRPPSLEEEGSVSLPPLRASRSQAVHSRDTMQTMLMSLRKRARRRSSTVTKPSTMACQIALRTVARLTPANAAR